MPEVTFLTEYLSLVIVGLCLCVGYIVKHWIKDLDNKYIPTICMVLGVALSIWVFWGNITPETILTGAFSGLASTGLHQALTQFIKKE